MQNTQHGRRLNRRRKAVVGEHWNCHCWLWGHMTSCLTTTLLSGGNSSPNGDQGLPVVFVIYLYLSFLWDVLVNKGTLLIHLSLPKWATLIWFHRTAPGNDLETASDTKHNYPCTNGNTLILPHNTSTSGATMVASLFNSKH